MNNQSKSAFLSPELIISKNYEFLYLWFSGALILFFTPEISKHLFHYTLVISWTLKIWLILPSLALAFCLFFIMKSILNSVTSFIFTQTDFYHRTLNFNKKFTYGHLEDIKLNRITNTLFSKLFVRYNIVLTFYEEGIEIKIEIKNLGIKDTNKIVKILAPYKTPF